MNKKEEIKEYWKDIIYKKGKLDEKSILRELEDYCYLLEEVSKVYREITNGLLSKPNYSAYTVIKEFEDRYWDKGYVIKEITEIAREAKTLKELKENLQEFLL